MLEMRIERAPLKETENRAILDEYNRLTSAGIPLEEFVHWNSNNPAGKTWHAILQTVDGRIVGHTSVFPLRTPFESGGLTPSKSEYSFLHEDFRKEKIKGREKSGKPAFIILLDELFQHCYRQGWGPIFASTNEKNQVFTRKVGLRPLEFPLWECLLALKPAQASRTTPNLTKWQRTGMFYAGVGQKLLWSLKSPFVAGENGIGLAPLDSNGLPVETTRLSFFNDIESLQWRYLEGQYVRFTAEGSAGDYVIAKKGSPSRFLRVCQWRLESVDRLSRFVTALIRQAERDCALGVRWAVYDVETHSAELLKRLRHAGFMCARRTRIVMVHKKDERYLDPSLWKMNDSLFSFDP